MVELLRDPGLYPSDPIRDTLPRYVSVLWWVVAWLSRYFPLEPMELVLFLAARALLFYAVYRLAKALAPGSFLAAASSMAVFALVPQPILAEGTIMVSIFEQSGTAMPFVLLALADFIEKRYWRSAIWLGIVANLTVMYAAYTTVYLLVIALLPDYRADWRRWVKSIWLLLAVSLPVIALLMSQGGTAHTDVALWYKANRFRSAHHLFPLAFPLRYWATFLLSCALVGVVCLLTRRSYPLLSRLSVAWLAANGTALSMAFVVAYGVKSLAAAASQPARSVDLLVAPAGVLVACVVSRLLETVLGQPRVVPTLLYLALWSVSINLWSYNSHPEIVLFLLVIASFVVIVYSVWRREQKAGEVRSSLRYALTICLALTLVIGVFRQLQYSGPRVRFAESSGIYPIALWAQRDTTRDAVFLVPPGDQDGWPSFRALSRRSVFVTWKDGTHILFAPQYTEEWVNRIAAIGFDIRKQKLGLRGRSPVDGSNINELYFKLRDEDVKRIASRYRIDYWIVPVEKPSAFPEVFRHGKWKVLQVSTPGVSATTPTSQPRRDSQR
ncbi:hypothetical protein HRbin16_01336 [bacterium HR16]|nr:hypothetical protein HRbin16_01336 [bacterium HR16]